MRMIFLVTAMAGIMLAGLAAPASAQEVIPDIRGLQPFTREANYMSLAGYLRWQYYEENDMWISRAEAQVMVAAQLRPPVVVAGGG